jgi:hypothetical protein
MLSVAQHAQCLRKWCEVHPHLLRSLLVYHDAGDQLDIKEMGENAGRVSGLRGGAVPDQVPYRIRWERHLQAALG